MRHTILAILILALTACGGETRTPLETPPNLFPSEIDLSASRDQMEIFGRDTQGDNSVFFSFAFPLDGQEDLEPRPADGVYGTHWWRPGDRHRYDTAWVFLTHEDPNQHAELQGFRVVWQAYGDYAIQINDRGMVELFPQGLPPYPYEPDAGAVPIDCRFPAGPDGAGVVEFFHQRGFGDDIRHQGKDRQLLQRLVIPEFGEYEKRRTLFVVPEVRWCYQLGGLWVAEHEDHGVIARIIITSMHPRYGFGVKGIRNPVTPGRYLDVMTYDDSAR